MTDMLVNEEIEEKLDPEKLDEYTNAAASIVAELRDFLSGHHADLIRATHTPNKWGESMEMPEAFKDPAYAGRIHSLRIACDNFVNVMRGHY